MTFELEDIKEVLKKFANGKDILRELLKESHNDEYVQLSNKTLHDVRIDLKHRYVKQILLNDKEYGMLTDIASDAKSFSELFELDYSEGFTIYIQTGLKLIGKNYGLNKFKTYKEKIFTINERNFVTNNDDDQDMTFEIANYYYHKCGFKNDVDVLAQMWELYGHDFVHARLDIVENEANFKTWINAQFEGFKFLKKLPEPYQLHGQEATKRYLSQRKSNNDDWRDKARESKVLNKN